MMEMSQLTIGWALLLLVTVARSSFLFAQMHPTLTTWQLDQNTISQVIWWVNRSRFLSSVQQLSILEDIQTTSHPMHCINQVVVRFILQQKHAAFSARSDECVWWTSGSRDMQRVPVIKQMDTLYETPAPKKVFFITAPCRLIKDVVKPTAWQPSCDWLLS